MKGELVYRVGRRKVKKGEFLQLQKGGRLEPLEKSDCLPFAVAMHDAPQWGKVRVERTVLAEILTAQPFVNRVVFEGRAGQMMTFHRIP